MVALAIALLALRRADVVERRLRLRLAEPAAGGAGSPPASAAPAPGSGALSRVAVVRYDAFEDLGGRMSFSAAILDETGRGLVLTAIHGRTETRSYVKQVPAADGAQRQLSPEETQAVRDAMKAGSS